MRPRRTKCRTGYTALIAAFRRRARKILWERDNRCHWCRRALKWQDVTLEHLTRLADGGADSVSNYAIACYRCNSRRGILTDRFEVVRKAGTNPEWVRAEKEKRVRERVRQEWLSMPEEERRRREESEREFRDGVAKLSGKDGPVI